MFGIDVRGNKTCHVYASLEQLNCHPRGGGGGWLKLRAEIVNGKLPGKLSVGLWGCTGVTICGVSRAKLTGLNFKH